MADEKLFTEFPPISTEEWEATIQKDLKGADYERKLVWRTDEGFNVRPYYRAENLNEHRWVFDAIHLRQQLRPEYLRVALFISLALPFLSKPFRCCCLLLLCMHNVIVFTYLPLISLSA